MGVLENDSEIAGRTDGIFPMCCSDGSDGRKADVDHYSSSSYYISCFAQKEKKKKINGRILGRVHIQISLMWQNYAMLGLWGCWEEEIFFGDNRTLTPPSFEQVEKKIKVNIF